MMPIAEMFTGSEDILNEISNPDVEVTEGVGGMVLRFLFNLLVVTGVSRWLYYPKGRRRDYLFVFVIISISIFLMVYLLGSLKLKIGFALGLFAIFGIIRYRTEQMPVREMTFLFVIIAMSVVNALSASINIGQQLLANGLLVAAVWLSERRLWLASVKAKLVVYDRVDNLSPEKHDELVADLAQRTGLKVRDVEVGNVDFLRDAARLKVFYESDSSYGNDVEFQMKLPREN